MPLSYQAVVLASDTGSRLYPLNSPATPKALLPIGNKAMLSFPLHMLEEGGVRDVLLVCSGEATATKVQAWVSKHYVGGLHVEVRTVAESLDTADAVRAVAASIRTDHFVLLSSDLVTDMPLRSLIASHFVRGSLVSSLLYPRRVSPSSETKPGKAPKNVDYIGLDEAKQRLLFYSGSGPESKRNIKIPLRALRQFGRITVRTDLVDSHMYIFDRAALLRVLTLRPAFTSIKQDVIPYLVSHQRLAMPVSLDKTDSEFLVQSALNDGPLHLPEYASSLSHEAGAAAAADYTGADGLGGSAPSGGSSGLCSVVLAGEGHYCARANTPQNFGDVCRDVATPQLALQLLGPPTNPKHDNWLDPSVKLGAKTTVGPGCIIGADTLIGDKASVKRSVVGADCKIGSNAKVINSVVMDGVVIGDGSHIQNSIVCNSCHIHDHCTLRDCQVGAGFLVVEGSEHRDEVLAKLPKTA